MARLTAGLPTKAAKIRKLGAAGYKRQAIADFLGISYQHARNVLEQRGSGKGVYSFPPNRGAISVSESPNAPYSASTEYHADIGIARFTLDSEGRIKLTPELLAALKARPGGLITARLENDELVIMGVDASIRFAQRGIPPWKPGEPLWSDELIAERRAEAAREDEKYRRWRKKRS